MSIIASPYTHKGNVQRDVAIRAPGGVLSGLSKINSKQGHIREWAKILTTGEGTNGYKGNEILIQHHMN